MVLNSSILSQYLNSSCNVSFGNATEKCTSWVYEESISIVEELEIPCEDWKRSLVGSLNSGGQLVSLIFSGFISDKYGRRNVLIIMIVLGGAVGILQSFSQNYWMFAILEFLNLSFGSGAYAVAFVMAVEGLPLERRVVGSAIIEVVCSISTASVGLLGWASGSWRWYLRICNIPSLFAATFVLFLPESLRWLHAKGKGKECGRILMKAAKLNGVHYSQGSLLELNRMSVETIDSSETTSKGRNRDSLIRVIKSPRLLLRLVFCAFCWFSSILTYNGLMINSVNISKGYNTYVDFVLVTLIELPSILVYFIILKFLNRKTGVQISFLCAGVSCVIYGTVPLANESYELIIYLAAKFFITICLIIMYIYTTECFPTTLRNSTVNCCSIVARIGGILSPQILLLENVKKSLPMIIFGILPFISILFLFKLPDTRNKKLPDTIAEAEQL